MKRSTALRGRYLQRAFFTSPVDHRAHPNVPAPTPAVRKRIVRAISTLDPQRICITDAIDFSSLTYPRVRLPSGRSLIQYQYHRNRHEKPLPFPDQTVGFLYFHTPSYYHAPSNPYDGAIRLRLAERAAGFHDGSNLHHPVLKTAWEIAPERIATHRDTAEIQHEELCDYLVQKKLAPEEVVRHMRMTRSVARLRDVFFVNFRATSPMVELRGHDGARAHLLFGYPFRATGSQIAAYEGAALAHLDIVATTDTKIQVGLRIHKLLYGPHKLPEEAANGYPVFLPSEGARVPRYTTGGPASTRVKKDSAAGRILLQMMEQEGGDKRARTE